LVWWFWHSPAAERPPGGESFEDVVARVGGAMARITAEHAGRDVVAVVHGGTVRAALAVALGIDAERVLGFACDTCSVTRMDHLNSATEGAAPNTPAKLFRFSMSDRSAKADTTSPPTTNRTMISDTRANLVPCYLADVARLLPGCKHA